MALRDRVKERVETDVGDPELDALIAEAQGEIRARFGEDRSTATPPARITVELDGSRRRLTLLRPADRGQAIEVVETSPWATETTLAGDDFRLRHGGRTLERLGDGTNPRSRWEAQVRVSYVPADDQPQRDEVVIKLVILSLTYRGLVKSSIVGDVEHSGSLTPDAYVREREALLRSLAPGRGLSLV